MHAVSAVTRHSCLLAESATHSFLCGLQPHRSTCGLPDGLGPRACSGIGPVQVPPRTTCHRKWKRATSCATPPAVFSFLLMLRHLFFERLSARPLYASNRTGFGRARRFVFPPPSWQRLCGAIRKRFDQRNRW